MMIVNSYNFIIIVKFLNQFNNLVFGRLNRVELDRMKLQSFINLVIYFIYNLVFIIGLLIMYYVYYNELVEEILDSDEEDYLIVDEDGIVFI